MPDVPPLRGITHRAWTRLIDDVAALARRRAPRSARLRGRGGRSVDVTVSLTSHRERFTCLPLALRSLQDQSVTPAGIVLWIPEQDERFLPRQLRNSPLTAVHVRTMPRDLGPASKLLPAMAEEPDQVIVTADDDVTYPYRWLESLLATHASNPTAIVCRRAHWITFDEEGVIRPYGDWEWETTRCGPDHRLFFTGHGGVLYPPGALPAASWDESLRAVTSPTNDDLWFNWMARLAGTPIARVPGRTSRRDSIPGSRDSSLMRVNLDGGANDRALRALTAAFGELDPRTGSLTHSAAD